MRLMIDRLYTWRAAVHCFARAVLLRLCVRTPDERGQGMLEYAIIGGIIIVGAVATLAALSGALNRLFTQITTTLGQY
jgi:Flp pilus assembly pilin Flp